MTCTRFRISALSATRGLYADDGGQISVVGVLGAAAFACLLLLVINTGYATSGKIELQNAADATALSGATWTARGLNIISLNNVTQTQILAIILVLRALDDALPEAIAVAEMELAACTAAAVFCAPSLWYWTAQLDFLMLSNAAVKPTRSTFAPGMGTDGPLWAMMRVLTTMSEAVNRTFPLIGEAESIRIARVDGADFGFLIPVRWTDDKWLPSLPVHEGSLSDLCEQARTGQDHPLDTYSGFINGIYLAWFPSGIHAFFALHKELNSRLVCGSSGPTSTIQRVGSLAECSARGGGHSVWQLVTWNTIAFDERRLSYVSSTPPDQLPLDGPARAPNPIVTDCGWTPPGSPVGGGRYQVVQEYAETVGHDEEGHDIQRFRYRISQYSFLAATVTVTTPATVDVEAPRRPGDPYPLLIGYRRSENGRSNESQTRSEMRYLAIVSRSRPGAVAPRYFVSPFGARRLAYAQARVYNDTMFSTFSQDWKVTLDRASMLEDGTLISGLFNLRVPGQLPANSPNVLGELGRIFGQVAEDALALLNNH